MLPLIDEKIKARMGDYYKYASPQEKDLIRESIEKEERDRAERIKALTGNQDTSSANDEPKNQGGGNGTPAPGKTYKRGRPRGLKTGRIVSLYLENDIIREIEKRARMGGVTFSESARQIIKKNLMSLV